MGEILIGHLGLPGGRGRGSAGLLPAKTPTVACYGVLGSTGISYRRSPVFPALCFFATFPDGANDMPLECFLATPGPHRRCYVLKSPFGRHEPPPVSTAIPRSPLEVCGTPRNFQRGPRYYQTNNFWKFSRFIPSRIIFFSWKIEIWSKYLF